MPLNVAPISYHGDEYLFKGISGAGASIAEGIEGMTKRLRQTKAMRTMAVDGMGMDPAQVDKMSPEEIQGRMEGIGWKNTQAKIQQAQQETQARIEMERAHGNYYNRFNQKAAREDAFSDAVNQYMQPRPVAPGDSGPSAPAPPLDPQALMMLEAKAGTLDPDKALQYMKQMGGGDTDNPLIYDKTSVPNTTIVKTKKGNEFQVLRNNDGAAPDAPPGYQMVADGKGAWKPVKIDTGNLSAGDRTKYQATYEKAIDGLIQSYSFAKGDPEMEGLIKERIAAHRKAITDLQAAPASATPPPASDRKAMGGYKLSAVYAGLKYLGGDPLDAKSWEKVK